METTGLTQQQMDRIVNYINGVKDATMNEEIITLFDGLYFRLHRRIMHNLIQEEKKNERLNVRIAKMQEKSKITKTTDENVEGYSCTGLDSVDIAGCLAFEMQALCHKGVQKSKILRILYIMYASWLASKKERLCLEHPVATERGPMFWRAYKKIDPMTIIGPEHHKNVASQNPSVATFIRNTARKYYDIDDKDLEDYINSGAPYKNALPRKGEKWCKPLSDNDIYLWKTKINE